MIKLYVKFSIACIATTIDYAYEMRMLIISLANYARTLNPNFLIVPQNVPSLMLIDDTQNATLGQVDINFISIIDGWCIEDLFYGANQDNVASLPYVTQTLLPYLERAKNTFDLPIFEIDYAWSFSNIMDSLAKNKKYGFIPYVANRSLNSFAAFSSFPLNENLNNVTDLAEAQNWLYLTNTSLFHSKYDFLFRLQVTNYDVVVISPFWNKTMLLNETELNSVKLKLNGARRQVMCQLSVGEVQSSMPYWQSSFSTCNGFIDSDNPFSSGDFRARYWLPEWQNILYGSNSSLIYQLVNAGCDGVFLGGIDSYFYFKKIRSNCLAETITTTTATTTTIASTITTREKGKKFILLEQDQGDYGFNSKKNIILL